MPDLNVTVVLPSGGARTAEVPDDVIVKDLMVEFGSWVELGVTGAEGRSMTYGIDSKALGRELKDDETLSTAGIPNNDRLMLSTDITAGAGSGAVSESPRMRRLRADQELMQDMLGRTNMISLYTHTPIHIFPTLHNTMTFRSISIPHEHRTVTP